MYHIESNNTVVGDYELIVWIKKHANGCYIPCEESDAEGICVKVPHKATVKVIDENGETTSEETIVTSYTDMVYRIKEDGLNGDEPLCTVTIVDEYTTIAEQKAAAYDILVGATK